MKKYYIDNFIITKLNCMLKESYQANYIITIHGDIYNFANTLKEAKKIIKESN